MLSSLFSSKPPEEKILDGDKRHLQPPKPLDQAPVSPLTANIHTPHDDALGELFQEPEGDPATSAPDVSSPSPQYTVPREVVYDPSIGVPVGVLDLPDPNIHPEAHVPLSAAAQEKEEIWAHLSKVLDLQTQIAGLHLEMEGIGTESGAGGGGGGKGDHGKGKGSRTTNSTIRPSVRQRATSGTMELLDLEHDEGVGVGDEEDEELRKDREREEEFATLAEQFEDRKEGVKNIMTKLDDLSKALTEFHALQAPKINFPSSRHSSRLNSLPAPASPVSSQVNSFSPPPSLAPRVSIPHSKHSSSNILGPARMLDSPARMLESPVSGESHEFP